jgi:hypothetical protein
MNEPGEHHQQEPCNNDCHAGAVNGTTLKLILAIQRVAVACQRGDTHFQDLEPKIALVHTKAVSSP